MNARRLIFTALAFAAALSFGSFASANVTVDRNYRLGDDPAEGALNGNPST